MGKILWNGREIYKVEPEDHKVHSVHLVVSSKHGENSLQVQGAGKSDSYGLTLDNFELIQEGTTENICVNGGFEKPNVKGKWGIFNGIAGWEGKGIEIGRGTIYNKGWNSQVLELDGKKNLEVTQKWNFDHTCKLIVKEVEEKEPEVVE